MPTDKQDLKERVARATAREGDTTRGLNFNTVFTLVREELGAEAAKAVDPTGKGSRVDFFSYAMADYLWITWNAADRLEKRLGGVEAVFRELGKRTVTGFLGSALGRTVFAIAGRDPRRVISAGPAGYRSAVGYGDRRVEWLGEREARFVFQGDYMPPAFHAAVIETALLSTDAVSPRVVGRSTGPLDSEYLISWS
ncbi:MAG: DUF2378 family protein [Anaeromyxobacter sp.]